MEEQNEEAQETHPTLQELMEGDEDDPNGITEQTDDTNKTAEVEAKKQQTEGETMAQSSEHDTRESLVSPTTDTQATNPDQEGVGKVENNKEPTKTGWQDDQKEMEITAAMVISPKEWRYLHNQRLHSIMRAAMGDQAHPNIPNLADYKYTPRAAPDYEIKVEPP